MISEPPPPFSSLLLLDFVLNSKIPTKNSPNFFVICWFDDALLILIHGFAWFRVDLASPQVSPPSIHEIHQILPPKSSISAPKSSSSSSSSDLEPGHPARSPGHPARAPDIRLLERIFTRGSGHHVPEIRPKPRMSGPWDFSLPCLTVLCITNSSGVRF